MYDSLSTTDTRVTDVSHAFELATLMDVHRNDNALLDRLRADLVRARTEQISADDDRLTDFWELAHRHAENAGYCEVYDRLVDAVGGPSREIEVVIEVTYRAEVTMTRAEYADGDYDVSDIVENYVDTSDPWRTDAWTA